MSDPAYIDAVIAGLVASCDAPNAAEEALKFISTLRECGYVIVPKELTESMIDAGCECDAYDIAVHENKKRHEDLMAKYPDLVKPRETHGAAPVQTLPIVWRAMLRAYEQSVGKD